jgi:RNA recognition motif-containing protein
MLFSTHGKVLDVVAMRGKMRGQAFVVFRDLQNATAARRREDGNIVLGKPMVRDARRSLDFRP